MKATTNRMSPVHPGEILAEEMQEMGMSANALAKALGVPANRITAILNERRGVTADTALRLSRYLGTTPEFWLNLQKTFELRTAQIASEKAIMELVKPRSQWPQLPPTNFPKMPRSPISVLKRTARTGSTCSLTGGTPLHWTNSPHTRPGWK